LANFNTKAELRQQLITALGNELGTYQIGANFPESAIIYVVDPHTAPPKNWIITGLQCLIYPPLAKGVPVFNGACLREEWQLRLIQYDRAKTCNLAYRRILSIHPDCQVKSQLPQTSESYEQWDLIIPQISRIN
jgi:hypothetical protein